VNKKEFIQLLEQEIEDFVQTQADKIVSFEDDPKEYILQKYPSLKDTLEDLMTDSFDEYITGIYVMAPKPTTFKILLHNGQHFYLIYAKDSYIAKISGKKYYLSDLGAEEYAIKSIADLLTMGMPPGAEGPDQEAENDMTKDADETPDAETDDTGGDEEELAENVDDNIPDSKKDDYGRPFVDPKGSKTYLSDKEREDMKPSSRFLKKMMDRLEKKLPSKKLRILKEAEEKKTDLKTNLIDLIRSSELSDEQLNVYIKSVKNKGKKDSLINQLTSKGYTPDRFKFGEKAIEKINRDLDNADLDTYFEYLENPKSLKSLSSSGKFYQELGLSKELVNSFVNIEPGADQGGSSIGKAELFLSLFFKDVGNSGGGIDPETGEIKQAKGDNNWEGIGNLEVKGTNGRLGQQGGRGLDATNTFENLAKDLLSDEQLKEFGDRFFKKPWTMSTSIAGLYKLAMQNKVPETEIQSKINKALDVVYFNQNLANDYFKTETDFTDLEEITKNLLKLNAASYSKAKGIDAILFVDTAGGENRYVIVKKSDYDKTIDNKKFWTTTKGPTGFQWTNVNPNLVVTKD